MPSTHTERTKRTWPYIGGKPYYSLEKCLVSAKPFNTPREWLEADKGAHDAAYRNGWIDQCCKHMVVLRRRTLEECIEIAKTYPTRNQWCKGDEASFSAARRNGWMDQCVGHMKPRQTFTPLKKEQNPMMAMPETQRNPPIVGQPPALREWQRALTRKNGKWPVVLLAGAPADIFRETKQKWEASKGIELKHHWDYNRSKDFDGVVPQDVDLVVVFKDFIGHAEHDRARIAAKKAGVPLLCTHSKKSFWEPAFYRFGIKNCEPLPLSRSPFPRQDAEPPKLSVINPLSREAAESAKEPTPEPRLRPATIPPLNIVIAQQAIPVTALPPRQIGVPRPETAALLAVLQAMCAEDGISVILEPTGFQVSPAKA